MENKGRIGVLTSGGDAQGMNACLKTIITMADRNNYEVYGFIGGFQGLINNDYKLLTPKDAEMYFNVGGSFIQAGRSKDFLDEEIRKKSVKNITKLKLECLIVLGGDGSIRGCKDLMALGVKVIAIPCTIDNDVGYSEKAIGFDTAVNNAVDTIDNIQQTMKTNGRILLVEVMGRHCGDIALYSGLCSESDVIMLPEKQQSVNKIIREVGKQLEVGNESPTVVISENQLDVQELAQNMEKVYNKECRAIVVGYIQRGGSPTMQDRLLAIRMGVAAMECAMHKKYDVVTILSHDEIKLLDIEKAVKKKRKFKEDLWNTFLDLKKFKTIKK